MTIPPYAIEKAIDSLLQNLVRDTSTLTKWFRDNYFKMDHDKCHLLACKHTKEVSIISENVIIYSSDSVKLLGITIDKKLNFNDHISKLCKKVSTKLHALESQFSYCPLVWMFHSRTLNNRINKLHERGLCLGYNDSHLTFEELLSKDNSYTIHHRNLQKLATEMYKIENNLSPSIMKTIFPERSIPYRTISNPLTFIQSTMEPKLSHTEDQKLGNLSPKIYDYQKHWSI